MCFAGSFVTHESGHFIYLYIGRSMYAVLSHTVSTCDLTMRHNNCLFVQESRLFCCSKQGNVGELCG